MSFSDRQTGCEEKLPSVGTKEESLIEVIEATWAMAVPPPVGKWAKQKAKGQEQAIGVGAVSWGYGHRRDPPTILSLNDIHADGRRAKKGTSDRPGPGVSALGTSLSSRRTKNLDITVARPMGCS